MIPAIHPACNLTLNPAPGDEGRVGSLPVMIHPNGVACFYLPTTQELYAINRGEPICISLSMDIRKTGFPPIMVGLYGEMFEQSSPPPANPSDDIRPDLALSLMLNGSRREVAAYLRKVANAVDEGVAVSGINSPSFEARFMSTDPHLVDQASR